MSRARDLADSADLNFDSGTLVIDSANNRVGVGEEAPNGTLHVKGSSAKIILEGTNNGGNSEHYLGTSGSSEQDFVINAGSDTMLIQSDFMLFRNSSGSSESARIDSSGNLLVGHTSQPTWDLNNGVSLIPSGGVFASRENTVGFFNRRTTDGDILEFRKNGTKVGSIGTHNGDLTIGAGDTGMKFDDGSNRILPWNTDTNSAANNIRDLGGVSNQWKDIYVAGGITFDNGSNYLDDYEEGTWTPVGYTGNSSGFNPTVTAFWGGTPNYVKVGGLVHVQAGLYFGNSSGSVTVGDFVVIDASSFPFTPISQPSSSGSFYAYNTNYAHVSCHMQTDGRVYLYVHTVVGNPLRVGGAFALGITYKTNS